MKIHTTIPKLIIGATAALSLSASAQQKAEPAEGNKVKPDQAAQDAIKKGPAGIGVEFANLPKEEAEVLGKGVSVETIAPGSTAEKAGLKIGDIITKVGDQPVIDIITIRRAFGLQKIGAKAKFTVRRGVDTKQIDVTFERQAKLIAVEERDGVMVEKHLDAGIGDLKAPEAGKNLSFDEMPKALQEFFTKQLTPKQLEQYKAGKKLDPPMTPEQMKKFVEALRNVDIPQKTIPLPDPNQKPPVD